MTAEAMQLLREWVAYYDGNGYSFRLNARSRELIQRFERENLYTATTEEHERMTRNGED